MVFANTCSKRFFNLSKYYVCSFKFAVWGVIEIFNLYSFENNSPSTMIIDLNFVFQENVFDIVSTY
jgi:hypothetical protein